MRAAPESQPNIMLVDDTPAHLKFISALNETLDKVTAFRCGGVDYVTKSFQLPTDWL